MRLPPPGLAGTMALGMAATMTAAGLQAGFGVLYPAMVREQGWSVVQVTAAFSISQLAYGPLALSSGVLMDRVGVRFAMFGGVAVIAVALTLLSQATTLEQVYVTWAMAAGLGLAGAGFVPMYKLLSIRAGARFPQALGVATAGGGLGALFIAPALQLAIDLGGWRLAVGALAVAIPALQLPLIAWVAPGPVAPAPHERHRAGPSIGFFLQPAVWLMLVASTARGYLFLLTTHQVAHLLQVGFLSAFAAGAAGFVGLLQAGSSISTGWPVTRWGSLRVQLVAVAVLVVGVAALVSSQPALAWLPVLYVVAASLGRGALNVCQTTIAREQFGGHAFGKVAGLSEIGFALGSFLGPTLVALAHDATGSYVPGLLTAIPAALITLLYTFSATRAGYGKVTAPTR